MKVKSINQVKGPLPIGDPYILAVYHDDQYPEGNGKMGPKASLKGRKLGNDFDASNSWRMYHGETIPGFPHHPHRGFEIVTIVEEGYADHFDSKGSKGRYGDGDVQLMSAGSGILHGEMFPLLYEDKPNPFRLFQIWVNLPSKSKLTEPGYKMLWSEKIPRIDIPTVNGGNTNIKIILGEYYGVKAIDPLAHSWAKDPAHHMGIALIKMEPYAEIKLDAKSASMNRNLFFYDGEGIVTIETNEIKKQFVAELAGDQEIIIKNGPTASSLLLLEGEPIQEPVAAYGPFVMNTEAELQEAFAEYRRTEFGGWPWGDKESDLVNPKDSGRFASYNFDQEIDKP